LVNSEQKIAKIMKQWYNVLFNYSRKYWYTSICYIRLFFVRQSAPQSEMGYLYVELKGSIAQKTVTLTTELFPLDIRWLN